VVMHTGVHVGYDIAIDELVETHDAVVLAGGAEKPRDLPIPGRDLDGIHFAMEFLPQQNRRVSDEDLHNARPILAEGKHVVVIGGGDTGSDCIGTSNRQGALSVTQIEIMPAPPEKENKLLTWPNWPMKMRTSSSQEEGVVRDYARSSSRSPAPSSRSRPTSCSSPWAFSARCRRG
jgi:glutamate synthase (NADPH) small chain